MGTGDAGCVSYRIERANMPASASLPNGEWGFWIADLDDRMTGACA